VQKNDRQKAAPEIRGGFLYLLSIVSPMKRPHFGAFSTKYLPHIIQAN
jgi:hypothetical protein